MRRATLPHPLIELQQNVKITKLFPESTTLTAFNRTTVECKVPKDSLQYGEKRTFNRTTVECKGY